MAPALPRRCLLCRAWGGSALCRDCLARFAPPVPRCIRCALALPQTAVCGECLRQPPPFAAAVAMADYGFPWDGLVARFKFQGQPELAGPLAAALADAVGAAADAVGEHRPSQVLAVPASPSRLAERGFNPAWELARRVARARRLPADGQVLQRLHDAPHQVGLGRAQRLHNLRDAFWVPPEHASRLRGTTVALVDDVLTTGATAALASQALLGAGAAAVHLWVLARTPPHGD